MKKLLSIMGLMSACLVGVNPMTVQAETINFSETMLQQITQQLNQGLPMMVNDMARWDSVSAGPGQVLNYYFTVVTREQPSTNDLKQLQNILVSSTCNDQSVSLLLENGVALSFTYLGNRGQSLASVRVNPADCGY